MARWRTTHRSFASLSTLSDDVLLIGTLICLFDGVSRGGAYIALPAATSVGDLGSGESITRYTLGLSCTYRVDLGLDISASLVAVEGSVN